MGRLGTRLRVTTVAFGHEPDGVTVYARRLVEERRRLGRPTAWFDAADHRWSDRPGDVVHVHVNDRLVDRQRDEWDFLVRTVHRRHRGMLLAVTLHDLPQPEEGGERFRRRADRYRRIGRLADQVFTNSDHERRIADDLGIASHVAPHPIFPQPLRLRPRDRRPDTIVVGGFIHPGKGLIDWFESVGPVGGTVLDGWSVLLVGGVSDGHRSHLADVRRIGRANGFAVTATGPLPARRWYEELSRATVVVAPHRHCSASGSVLAAISAGHRPVASANGFTAEIHREDPDRINLVGDARDWLAAIQLELARERPRTPDRGWRSPATTVDRFDEALAAA